MDEHTVIGQGRCHHGNDQFTCEVCKANFLRGAEQLKALAKKPPVVEPLVMADHPLQAKIEAGQLVIRIGVKRLAECSTGDDLGALHGRKITDPEEFCEDVIREMMIEDEQGTTPLIQFLGEMELAAFESGSLAVEL